MYTARWYRQPETIGIGAIILALFLVWTCTGCSSTAPGVRITAGAFGVEVSVQVGGGELAPRLVTETPAPAPVNATPPEPVPPVESSDPVDEEEKKPDPALDEGSSGGAGGGG